MVKFPNPFVMATVFPGLITTRAFRMTAFDLSVTVPLIDPFALCASALEDDPGFASINPTNNRQIKIRLPACILASQSPEWVIRVAVWQRNLKSN
ncbi:hypothetical protein [Silvibacterium dinghuense]|uniref:hypothetical protein n=1 Tax=Silvibacterium dinghuense TaxID=1560006 RepID=UPI0019C7C5C6|nr:hypothetical protein [Silvibacterium dinghuense]GGH17363.1 hypothetical protein GCM10011586_39840 [Silvibacterium dinghuense]